MDTPKFKQGQKIEYMGCVLVVEHARRSVALHDWVYTIAGHEVAEAALLRAGAKPAQDGTR